MHPVIITVAISLDYNYCCSPVKWASGFLLTLRNQLVRFMKCFRKALHDDGMSRTQTFDII
jgi:hypothetical protein